MADHRTDSQNRTTRDRPALPKQPFGSSANEETPAPGRCPGKFPAPATTRPAMRPIGAALETQRDDILLPSARQEWATLPDPPTTLAAALQQLRRRLSGTGRYSPEQIQAARAPGAQPGAQANLGNVCMEIVAGVDSPPEFASLRMEYQVARLSAPLAGAPSKPKRSTILVNCRNGGGSPARCRLKRQRN